MIVTSLTHIRNMFFTAAPYFQYRFEASPWINDNFQSSIIVISTNFGMASILTLTRAQKNASYPRRISLGLLISLVTSVLLTLSAVAFKTSINGYFTFLLIMVAFSAIATSFQQNGLFSLVSGYGREEYVQGIMTGQGIAGVAPCIVEIVSVLSVSQRDAENGDTGDPVKSAFAFFLTAVGVFLVSILAFGYLLRRHGQRESAKGSEQSGEDDQALESSNESVSMLVVFWKLKYFATAVFLCFAITMVFPVFAQEIYSVTPEEQAPRLLQKATFIPLALLVWNTGDVLGKAAILIPAIRLTNQPRVALAAAIGRSLFIPLFLLCNIKGRGAVIQSDLFYLVVVQFLFGLTNGWLGSACMMAAPHWVDESEKEAAGGFMGLVLVSGLTAGGLLSFVIS